MCYIKCPICIFSIYNNHRSLFRTNLVKAYTFYAILVITINNVTFKKNSTDLYKKKYVTGTDQYLFKSLIVVVDKCGFLTRGIVFVYTCRV